MAGRAAFPPAFQSECCDAKRRCAKVPFVQIRTWRWGTLLDIARPLSLEPGRAAARDSIAGGIA
jgi:hypothetical protein